MAGLLSGLGSFGLGNLENMNLYEEPKGKPETEAVAKQVVQLEEKDFLFDKTYTCTACDKEFKNKSVRVGKAKLLNSDMDLRPNYELVDPIKYDVVLCPHCGYTALSRYFKFLTSSQLKMVKTTISQNFKAKFEEHETYSYEEALERYKLALANAIVKRAKASEKAYICLKTGWLLRGMAQHLDKEDKEYPLKKEELLKQENEYLKNALEGFITARQTESFPMCGMDDTTVSYLIAVLAMRFGQYDISSKLVSNLIVSNSSNPRMSDKIRELKAVLMKKIKEES